ncbi:MAG: hypothetical protein KDB80_09865 [Planctomycetes bacterium]|nr:hypothetical protein [Planctomycetota bacterium]
MKAEGDTQRPYHETRIDPAALPSANPNLARIACAAAAIVGALVWGGISFYANREIGWVAWGIGALVGGACVVAGGRGTQMAVTAAILAVASIGVGKYLSITWAVKAYFSSPDAAALYEDQMADAEAWQALGESPDEDAIATFMIEREWNVDMTAAQFREYVGPGLADAAANKPSFDDWGSRMAAEVDVFDAISTDLHPLDLLWVILGIGTAYQIVMRRSQADVTAMQRRRRTRGAAEPSAE